MVTIRNIRRNVRNLLRGAAAFASLLVVPAPAHAAATAFADVAASHWAALWIDQLATEGVTSGCGVDPLRYCPANTITRAEMAVFLLRAVHGSGYQPPVVASSPFADVPATHWAKNWISRLYDEGVTTGCAQGPLRYCPDQPVSRAEMAVFLLRARHGAAYVPPVAANAFADVADTSWSKDWINQLSAEGITAGCAQNPLRYCPAGLVSRAEMAAFLLRMMHGSAYQPPALGQCRIFPANNIWHHRVDSLPVHARSSQWIASIGGGTPFHMDFGSGVWDGGPIGIPFNFVTGSQIAKSAVRFTYDDESDAGPYPIPASPLIENGSDHHILMVDQESCLLYELFAVVRDSSGWRAGSGAIWDLRSNLHRPAGWTSADAAGLPIYPGLIRYDEVASGVIAHPLRFTAAATNSYIWPARHLTSGTAGVLTATPPMGAMFRLKASYDISGFPAPMRVILTAMKQYGIILADNGTDWYVSGAPDERWDNDMLHLLDVLTGNNFEAVDTSSLIVSPNSGATP